MTQVQPDGPASTILLPGDKMIHSAEQNVVMMENKTSKNSRLDYLWRLKLAFQKKSESEIFWDL